MELWVLLIAHNLEVLGGLFEISTPASIYKFQEIVKEKRPNDTANVDAAGLTVWRCTDPTTILDAENAEVLSRRIRDLFSKQNVKKIGARTKIAELNILEGETLLVQLPFAPPAETAIPAKRQTYEDEFFERFKRFKSLKLTNAQPSELNDYEAYLELQKDKSERILNNRPERDVGIPPLALLYRGFGLFSDSIKSGTISDSIKGDVDKLVQASCDISSEEAKKKATEDLLHRILFPDGVLFRYRIKDPSQRATDGHILTAANGGPLFIVEYKREIAAAEAQPAAYFMQLVGSAHEALSQTLRGWRQPALGLAIRGEYISFFGFLMLDTQVRMLPLTPTFHCNKCASEGNAPLYAAFSAAKDLLKNIQEDTRASFFEFPVPMPQNQPDTFPYIWSLQRFGSDNQQEQRIDFRITKSLGKGVPSRFVYVAGVVNADSKPILVKFSKKYSKELHGFCSMRHFAPQLLAFEEFPGGWLGIAMEYFPTAVRVDESPSLIKHGETWLKQIDEIVSTLHEHGYVHGDLRAPNFIADEERLLLIDFDWGGKEGLATFPDTELIPMLRAHRGVKLIEMKNDKDVVEYTKKAIDENMQKLRLR